jgi:hypothetical protein
MPKVCRDYPNCSNLNCGFLHPIVVEQDKSKQEYTPKPETKYEIPEPVLCFLYRRKNLGVSANTVRGAVFSIVKGLTTPFKSLELAISWIREHGEKDYVYQIRVESQAIQHWVFDDFSQWHKTQFRQDTTRGYKSDKNPNLRIH